jgi:S-adenosylmethionine decarboxylase
MEKKAKTLLLDLIGCDKTTLENPTLLYSLFDKIITAINMTPLTAPSVLKCDYPKCPKPEDWGYTGQIVIVESHICFHTWPEYRKISIDISSCKGFEHEKVIEIVKDLFMPEDLHEYVIMRV